MPSAGSTSSVRWRDFTHPAVAVTGLGSLLMLMGLLAYAALKGHLQQRKRVQPPFIQPATSPEAVKREPN